MSARGVVVGVAATLLLACGAAVAPADTPSDTATTATSPAPTTTATVPITTAVTTAAPTTTAPPPPTTTTAPPPPTTTTAPPRTTTAAAPTTRSSRPRPRLRPKPKPTPRAAPRRVAAATATRGPLAAGCPLAAAALLVPGERPLLLRPTARAGRFRYPAGGAIVRAASVELREGACRRGAPEGAAAQLRSLSLLGGAVTAARVSLLLGGRDASAVTGLGVLGRAVPARAGVRIPLQGWGYVVVGAPAPVALSRDGVAEAALAVHLLRPHAGLPAGTVLLAPAGGSSVRAVRRHRRATHRPLKVTPPLALRHYVFPVVGPCDYSDTYGGFRPDVNGNWHHGDDLFAPLGAPVVAVANGTVNRVGWEQLGGWRLWVRDVAGDEFYYAHLSGYAPAVLHGDTVQAGEVIGFVGNTGDAFPTTQPHVHFEIHPRSLLHLGYDGAVDPTSYLAGWTHVAHVRAPRPAHPAPPADPALRREARYVWRELLAARHLIRRGPSPAEAPHVRLPASVHRPPPAPRRVAVAAAVAHRPGTSSWSPAAIAALAALAALAGLVPLLRRRRAAARRA